MYELILDERLKSANIKFSEPLTISNSLDVTKSFIEAINRANTICINHESVEDFDLSYLQNLFALQKYAVMHRKEIKFSGKHPDSFISLIKAAGCPAYAWMNIND